MSAHKDVLIGEDLLVAVTDAMVEFHERYHNRAAIRVRRCCSARNCWCA